MKSRISVFAALAAASALAFAAAMLAGKGLSAVDSIDAIVKGATGPAADILWKIRFPRVLLGAVAGAGLAVAGALMQGMLRNPLADPFTLGVSSGAALGATAVKLLGFANASWSMSAGAVTGALCAAALVYAAAARTRFTAPGLILAGVILSFFLSSLVYLLFALARPDDAQGALLWMMGDLSWPQLRMVAALGAFVAVLSAAAFVLGRDLDALTLGDEKAKSLGVDPGRARKTLFLVAAMLTGGCVAGAGVVGFVGLMIPHVVRPFTGTSHRLLIPACALAGAALLCGADAFARSAVPSHDLPVGVIMGLLGGLFMLGLLLRGKSFRFF